MPYVIILIVECNILGYFANSYTHALFAMCLKVASTQSATITTNGMTAPTSDIVQLALTSMLEMTSPTSAQQDMIAITSHEPVDHNSATEAYPASVMTSTVPSYHNHLTTAVIAESAVTSEPQTVVYTLYNQQLSELTDFTSSGLHRQDDNGETPGASGVLNQCSDYGANNRDLPLNSQPYGLTQADMGSTNDCLSDVDGLASVYSSTAEAHGFVPVNRLRPKVMCEICGFQGKKHDLKIHMNKHTNESTFNCDQCDRKYRYKRNLLEHKQNTHTDPAERIKHVCEYCGASYNSKPALLKHLRVKHVGKRTFGCKYCEMTYVKSQELTQHLAVTHLEEQISSGELVPLSKTAVTRRLMTQYQQPSSDDSGAHVYQCPVCSKEFRAGYMLCNHMKTHTDERPFKCDVCGDAFKQLAHLNGHRMIHEGLKPHECELCGKAFRNRSKLRRHQASGCRMVNSEMLSSGSTPGRKKLQCLLCDRVFVNGASFKTHLKQHQSGSIPSKHSPEMECGSITANVEIVNIDSNETTNIQIFKQCDDGSESHTDVE